MTSKIKIIHGDITRLAVDAIVNAANTSLMGGGGVDGAIHRNGGPTILEECRKIVAKQGGCKTGQAVITSAGNLPSKYVIHTVGPVWTGGNNNEALLLESCYLNSLDLALKYNCKTVAFPNISTGVYGFPKEMAAEISLRTFEGFLRTNDELDEVILVCFDVENFKILQGRIEKYF